MTVFEQGYMGTPEKPGLMRQILEQEGIRVGDYNANRIETLLELEKKGRVIRTILPDITVAELKRYAGEFGIDLKPYSDSLNIRMVKHNQRLPADEFRTGDVLNRLRKHKDKTKNEKYRRYARTIGNLLDRVRVVELSRQIEAMGDDVLVVLPHYVSETENKPDHSLMPNDLEHHLQEHHRFANTPMRKKKKYDPVVIGSVSPGAAQEKRYDLTQLLEKLRHKIEEEKTELKIKPGQYYPDLAVGSSRGEGSIRISLVEAVESVMNFLGNLHIGKLPVFTDINELEFTADEGASIRMDSIRVDDKDYTVLLNRFPVKILGSESKDYFSNWTSIVPEHSCDHKTNMAHHSRHKIGVDTYFCRHILEGIMWAAYEINYKQYQSTVPIIPIPIFSKGFIDYYRKLKFRTFIDTDGSGSPKPLSDALMSGLLMEYVKRHPDSFIGGKDFWTYYTPEIEVEMQERLAGNGSIREKIDEICKLHTDAISHLKNYKRKGEISEKDSYLDVLKKITPLANELNAAYGYNFMNHYTCLLFKKALQKQ